MKKTIFSITIIGIIIVLFSIIGKNILENKINIKLKENKTFSSLVKSHDTFKCDILPTNCYLDNIILQNDIFIKKATIDNITIFNIIKFINNEKENPFWDTGKYTFKLNLYGISQNKNNPSNFNLKIKDKIKSLGDGIAENTIFIDSFIGDKQISSSIIDGNLTRQEDKSIKLNINAIETTVSSKDINALYFNFMSSAYHNGLNQLNEKRKEFNLPLQKKLSDKEIIEHIKNNTKEQVILLNKLLNKANLNLNNQNIDLVEKILIGDKNNEETTFKIEKK